MVFIGVYEQRWLFGLIFMLPDMLQPRVLSWPPFCTRDQREPSKRARFVYITQLPVME
jgi:hypothetical protein